MAARVRMDTELADPRPSRSLRASVIERLRSSGGVAQFLVVGVLFACSAVAVGLYVFTAFHRMRFRFELEWMEGGILEHVKRVLSGKTVYPAPSVDFAAFIYNPLYYYVAAPFCAVFGLAMFPLRLVSFLASVVSFLLLCLSVKKHTGKLLAGVLATGLFAGTFAASGAWFDLARIDSLGLALVLAAGYLLIGPRDRPGDVSGRALIASGALAALAILTKQSAAFVVPVLLLRAFTIGRFRGAALFGGALLLPLGFAVLALQIQSHGWYWYYAFQLPSTHTIAGREPLVLDFWRYELFAALPIAATTALLELCCLPITGASRNWFVPAFAVTLVLVSYVTRLHMGSYTNDLMPAHAGLAILSTTLLSRLA
ncbi:MAG TPA: glycosyltransferase family 39 protein, partial [Acidothermaceae bacterium]